MTQENMLIRASYQMTLNEKRLLVTGISKLDPTILPKRIAMGHVQMVVTADDWREVYPADQKPFRSLRTAASKLMKRTWWVDRDPVTNIEEEISWLDVCAYDHNNQQVKLTFNYSTAVRLQGFRECFTSYGLAGISKLSSFNQIRIYEIVSQWRNTGWLSIRLDDLREILGATEKLPKWYDLNRVIISPAVKSISEKTDISLSYTTKRKGRRIDSITFTITEKPLDVAA